MTMLILHKRKILIFFCWVLLFVTGFYAAIRWPEVKRSRYGVKKGVTLEGEQVGGLLPEEVRKLVTEKANIYFLKPRNAGLFPETGEVIPEQAGRGVDIDTTVRNILQAAPGEEVSLVTYSIPATVSQEFFIPVYQGDPSRKEASITVNVDWGEEVIPEMLSVLNKNGVKVTFFITGKWAEKFPELVRKMSAEGHEIANHGLYHGHPNQMSKEELSRLVLENSRLLAEVTGKPPVKLFAPPYGEFNERVLSVVGELGYRTIMWTVDTVDWKRPAPEVIIQRVTGKIKPGSIILMHPTAPTVAALEQVIKTLKEQGYTFVTLTRLLRNEAATQSVPAGILQPASP